MADGEEYIYTGRLMSMKEVDRKLNRSVLNLYDRAVIFYNKNIKPIFFKKRNLESIEK